jgi:dTDP-4-amino-4,6-dideoxygalactose transaminase
MNELHAVVALDQLSVLGDMVRWRGEVAAVYADLPLRAQAVREGDRHSYVHWVARVADRAGVRRRLDELGVRTKPYFAAVHRGPLGAGELLAVTDALHAEALALPLSSEITVEQAERVVAAVRRSLRPA